MLDRHTILTFLAPRATTDLPIIALLLAVMLMPDSVLNMVVRSTELPAPAQWSWYRSDSLRIPAHWIEQLPLPDVVFNMPESENLSLDSWH